ncbi:TPA: hypothetical protein ACGO43_000358 [Streptococcus suis]
MTNEKLGVLLVDVPEPMLFKYYYIEERRFNGTDYLEITRADLLMMVKKYAYKCTQEEAEKYPQFRWVALEELT